MRIEPYSAKYFGDVVRLITDLHAESLDKWEGMLDVEKITETVSANGGNENSFLLIINDKCQGIIFGFDVEFHVNKHRYFQVALIYVDPFYRGHGTWFLKKVQGILKSRRMYAIIVAVLENSQKARLDTFYRRLGYEPMETHYIRHL